ncbi:hypothetical protein CSUI_004502 [Cystoisospora suis]|uniref:FPL domain-containing protein n=1 Tax=Cystoisospora suis TaxID=483139 RepID=A0A2C6L0T4_9APIC|nr:hypothetical protein CSUI_004502 [Cystoisospora suis]
MWFWGGGGGGGVGASGALKEAIGHHHGGQNSRQHFYTEEHLQALFDALHAFDCIDERNRDAAVEILRQIAELLVWGERHRNEAFFDIFCEQNILSYFVDIVNQPRVSDAVKVQLLQTLSILVQNMRRKTAIYYLFSNNYINALLSATYDFNNEEVVAWYVSFIKGLSLLVTPETVKLFLNRRAPDFPVYSEAIKFFIHRDSMVRTHVRTVTLSIFKIREPIVEEFVVRRSAFFSHVACYLRAQWAERCRALRAVRRGVSASGASLRQVSSPGPGSPRPPLSSPTQSTARGWSPSSSLSNSLATLRSGFAECEEFLEYIQDIFGVGVKAYNDILVERLLLFTYLPVFVGCLCRRGPAVRPTSHCPDPESATSIASSPSLPFPVPSSGRSSPQTAGLPSSPSRYSEGAPGTKSNSSPRLLVFRGLRSPSSASRLRSSPIPGQRSYTSGSGRARVSSPLSLSARSCSSLSASSCSSSSSSSSWSSSSVYSSSICSSGDSSPHRHRPSSDTHRGERRRRGRERNLAGEECAQARSASPPSNGSMRRGPSLADTAGGDSGPISDLSSESSTGQTRTLVLLGQVVLPRKGEEDTHQRDVDVLGGRQGESGGASDDAYGSAAEGEENDGKDRKRGHEENEDGRKAEGEGGVKGTADDGVRREGKEEKDMAITSSRRPFHMSTTTRRRNLSGGRGKETEELCRPQQRSSASYTDVLYQEKDKERNRRHKQKHRKARRRSRSNGREEEEGQESSSRRLRRHRRQEGGGQQSVRKKKSKKSRREQGHDHRVSAETSHSPSNRFSSPTEARKRCDGPPTTPFIGDATQQLVALYLLTQTLATIKEPKLLRPVLALLLLPRVPKPLLHLASALSPPTPAGYTALENPAQCAGAVDLFLSDGERELHEKTPDERELHEKTSDFNANIGGGEGGEVMSSSLDLKVQKQGDEGLHEKGTTADPMYASGRDRENERATSQGNRCLDRKGPADSFQQGGDVGPVGSPPPESSAFPSEAKEGKNAEGTLPSQNEGQHTSPHSKDKSSSSSTSGASAKTAVGGGVSSPLPSQDSVSCQISSPIAMSRVTSTSGEEKYLMRERSFSQGYASPEQTPHHVRGDGDGGLSRYSSFREERRRGQQASRNSTTMIGGVSQTPSSPRPLPGGGDRMKSAAAVIAARRPVLSVAQKAVERAFEELLDFPMSSEEPDAVVDTALGARLSRTQSERIGGKDVEGDDGDLLSVGQPPHRGMFSSGREEGTSRGEKRIHSSHEHTCSSEVGGKESCIMKTGESKGEKEEARGECWSRRNSGGVSSTVWASPRQMHRDDEEDDEEEEERGKDPLSKDGGESQGLEKFKSSREDDEEAENEESRGLTQTKTGETTGEVVEDVTWVPNPYRHALERFISPVTATARRSDTTMLVGGVLLHAAITHPLVSKVFLQNADILPAERQHTSTKEVLSHPPATTGLRAPFSLRASNEGKRSPPFETLHAHLTASSCPSPSLSPKHPICGSSLSSPSGCSADTSATCSANVQGDSREEKGRETQQGEGCMEKKETERGEGIAYLCHLPARFHEAGQCHRQRCTEESCSGRGEKTFERSSSACLDDKGMKLLSDRQSKDEEEEHRQGRGEERKMVQRSTERSRGDRGRGKSGSDREHGKNSSACGWSLVTDLMEGIRRNAAEGFLRTVTVRLSARLVTLVLLAATRLSLPRSPSGVACELLPCACNTNNTNRTTANSKTSHENEGPLSPLLLRRTLPGLLRLLHSVKKATATAVQISLACADGDCQNGSPTSSHAAVDTFWDEWETLKASPPIDLTALGRDVQILLPPPSSSGVSSSSSLSSVGCARIRGGSGRFDCHTQLWREASTTKELQRRAIQQWLILRQIWKTVGAVTAVYTDWQIDRSGCLPPYLADRLAAEARVILLGGGGRESLPDIPASRFPYTTKTDVCTPAEMTTALLPGRRGEEGGVNSSPHGCTSSTVDEGCGSIIPSSHQVKSDKSRTKGDLLSEPAKTATPGEIAGEKERQCGEEKDTVPLMASRGVMPSEEGLIMPREAEPKQQSRKSDSQLSLPRGEGAIGSGLGGEKTLKTSGDEDEEEEISRGRVGGSSGTAPCSEVSSVGRREEQSNQTSKTSSVTGGGGLESYSTLLRKEEEGRSLCHPFSREDLPVGSAGLVQVDGGTVSVWLRGRNFIRCSVETLEGVATRYYLQSETHLLLVSPSQTTPGRADVRMSCPLRNVECQVDSTDSRRLQLFLFTSSTPPGDVLWSRATPPQCTYASCSWCRTFPSPTRGSCERPRIMSSSPPEGSSCRGGVAMAGSSQGSYPLHPHVNGEGSGFSCPTATSSVFGGGTGAISCHAGGGLSGGVTSTDLEFKERFAGAGSSKDFYGGEGTCRMRPALWELRVSFDDTLRCCIAAKSIQEGRNKVRSELRRYIDRLLADSNADDSLLFTSPFIFPPPETPESFLVSRSSSFSSPSLTSLSITPHVTRSRGWRSANVSQRSSASGNARQSSRKASSLFG